MMQSSAKKFFGRGNIHTYLPHDAQLDGRKKYPGVLCRVLEWQPHPASALKRMLPHAPAG